MQEMKIPASLFEFQRTFIPPPGVTAVDLLREFDEFMNGDAPAVSRVARAVPISERDGWRVTADVFVPAAPGPLPIMAYFHGGAWVMGSPGSHRRLAAEIANLGVVVVSCDYRRAPKHRFPAAFEDAREALEWTARHAAEFGGDRRRLLLAGDSAGANLAAAVLATGPPVPVAGTVLLYGIYDFHRALPLMSAILGGADAPSQHYLPPESFAALRDDPRLSPMYHCGGFPPTFITAGALDPLVEQSRELATELARHGVAHELHVAPEAPHGYLQFPGFPPAKTALQRMRSFVESLSVQPEKG